MRGTHSPVRALSGQRAWVTEISDGVACMPCPDGNSRLHSASTPGSSHQFLRDSMNPGRSSISDQSALISANAASIVATFPPWPFRK